MLGSCPPPDFFEDRQNILTSHPILIIFIGYNSGVSKALRIIHLIFQCFKKSTQLYAN